jgi:hypothetical protein
MAKSEAVALTCAWQAEAFLLAMDRTTPPA